MPHLKDPSRKWTSTQCKKKMKQTVLSQQSTIVNWTKIIIQVI